MHLTICEILRIRKFVSLDYLHVRINTAQASRPISSDDTVLRPILNLTVRLVSFQGELEELIRLNILSVLVKVFRHERYIF